MGRLRARRFNRFQAGDHGAQGEAAPAGPPTGVAAMEAPGLLVDDVRAFFRSRR